MNTNEAPCRTFAERQVSPAVEAYKIRQDIVKGENYMSKAESHARQIRDLRHALLAELVAFDE